MAKLCGKNITAAMNKRLSLQVETMASDGQGGFNASWENTADIWGSVEPLNGYEKFQASQTQTPLTHKVTIRYRTGVTTKHRLIYDGRIFNIKEVLNLREDNVFLQLKCLEKA